ncbi:hypothetical protein N9597_00100 [Candidatus Marinimicrobia bacterium]|nr:hypothetical protein [Candidatus Neomarinimicrobiota bacterium]
MANTRIIRKEFFNDAIIAGQFKIKERYFLIGMACNSDDFGRFWWDARNIKATIFPTDNISTSFINKMLDKLHKEYSWLCKYDKNGVVYGHFIYWFDAVFVLKQRIDRPRLDVCPDCKTHNPQLNYELKKRGSSLLNKDKVIKTNINESILSGSGILDKKYHPSDFEEDTTGNSYLGYCSKCGETEFCDKRYGVYSDSKCCKSKILPSKALYQQLSVKSLE